MLATRLFSPGPGRRGCLIYICDRDYSQMGRFSLRAIAAIADSFLRLLTPVPPALVVKDGGACRPRVGCLLSLKCSRSQELAICKFTI